VLLEVGQEVVMYIYLDMVEGFTCEMCGKCCRNEWLVTVDKESYQRNESFFAAKGKNDEFQRAFVPLTDQRSFGEYAYIAKGAAGGCYFLTKDNYCILHREAGHEHLDHVCQTFPRYPMNTTRGLELTLTLNCPAVFKRIERNAPLEVIRSEQPPLEVQPDSVAVHVFPSQRPENSALRYYFELEQHFIDILQSRSLKMAERLQFLTATIEKICKAEGKDSFGQSLNQIIYENYDILDSKEKEEGGSAEITAEILLEHFFVNIIFQKNFYVYGLRKGLVLLQSFWQRLEYLRQGLMTAKEDRDITRVAIMQIAFEHNHHRVREGGNDHEAD